MIFGLLKRAYKNLEVSKRNLYEDAKGSVLEEFLNSGYIEKERTKFATVDFSDILRVLYLHQHGGLYQDLDIWTLERIPDFLPKNFVTLHPWKVSD